MQSNSSCRSTLLRALQAATLHDESAARHVGRPAQALQGAGSMPQLEPAVLQCRQHLCTAGCSWSACGKGRGLALHEALQGVGRVPQLKPAALSPTAQAAPAHSRMPLVSLRQGAVACPAWSTAGPWQSAEAGQSEPHGQSQALAPRTAGRAASLQFLSTAGCNWSACTRKCTRHCRPLARCCS